VKGIDVSKCRVMESKKKPLWLTLYNADETKDDIVLMLKVGDDLRQDALVIQLLRVMNLLWAKEGLDMQMMLYDCISTGDERGLLQVVLNSTTIGSVLLDSTDKYKKANNQSVKAGSMLRKIRSAFKALRDFSVLQVWIKEQIQKEFPDIGEGDEKWEEELDKRTQSFIISTAAYRVASYVLGLGDRHNDNLMITKKAHFFHIDFGHMLGNFKSKYGIKRERAPFVFTYAMKQCMNDEQYDDFKDLCCDIYNILRQNASMLVSLISLAIPCNLPELQSEKDVVWIYEKLMVHVSEEEASQHFRDTLDDALGTTFTRLNEATHLLAHA
jgi:phosphatidylinositol-4,5-bisphosphate 3-kinase